MRFLKYQHPEEATPIYINTAQIYAFVYFPDENVTRISANGEGMTSKLPGDWTAKILGDAEVVE